MTAVAARNPVEHLESAAIAAARSALDVRHRDRLVPRAAREQCPQRAQTELALRHVGREAGNVRPDHVRVVASRQHGHARVSVEKARPERKLREQNARVLRQVCERDDPLLAGAP